MRTHQSATRPSQASTRGHTPATHLLSNLDRESSEPRKDDAVTLLDGRGDEVAVASVDSGADGEDEALGRRGAGRGGRKEQAGGGFLMWGRKGESAGERQDGTDVRVTYLGNLDALDENAVEEGSEGLD